MTADQIIKLNQSGFTAEQIENIINSLGENIEPPAEPAPAPAEPTEPAPAPAMPSSDEMQSLLTQMNETLKAMQLSAIRNTNQPAPADTVDSILASIINPPANNK